MADTFKNYSPDLIVLTWGPIAIAGYADGTMITVARDEDAYTKKAGATGDIVRIRSLNLGGSIKFILQQSALTNDLLSAEAALDQGFNSFRTLPVLLKDLNGNTLIHGANAWIKKLPSVEFGKDLTNREWILDCARLDTFFAGGAIR